MVIGKLPIDTFKGQTLAETEKIEIPDHLTLVGDKINLGTLLYVLDRGSDPETLENGMIWKVGTVVKIRSNDTTVELGVP
jgi:hypothetical protein